MDLDRGMPASIEAERAILGAVLLDNKLFQQAQILFPEDFSLDSHRRIFSAMCGLHENEQPIDIVTISEELKRRGELEAVGGVTYVSSLTNEMRVLNIESYVKCVRDKCLLRKTIHTSNIAIAEAIEGRLSPQEIIEASQAALTKIAGEKITSEVQNIFLSAHKFSYMEREDQIDWMVEGVIQRGSNGIVIARPKTGKSMVLADLAIALSTGRSWLGFHIPRRVKVAFVSREDNPFTTSWRLRRLMEARDIDSLTTDGYFYLNSKAQSKRLMLDNQAELAELIGNLKRLGSEFLILDVFRKMHTAEENDNTEMQRVLELINRIYEECGCTIAIIHHDNKREEASLTERIRGASAIAGWAEWVGGLSIVSEEDNVRELKIELKAALAPPNVHFRIEDALPPQRGILLHRLVDWVRPKKGKSEKAKSL